MTIRPYRLAKLHHVDEELRVDGRAARVVRVIDDQQLRPRMQVLAGVGDVRQKLFAVGHVERDAAFARARTGVDVRRKIGAGNDRRVARAHQGQAHVAETLLSTEADDDFLLGSSADGVLAEVLGGDFAAEIQDADRLTVAVVERIAGRFDQFLDRPTRAAAPTGSPCRGRSRLRRPAACVQHRVDPREQAHGQAAHPIGSVVILNGASVDGASVRGSGRRPGG